MSVNRVEISGTVEKDPIVRPTKTGASWVALRIGHLAGKEGTKTHWYDVVAFRGVATEIEQNIRKGMEVLVVGKLDINMWKPKDREDAKWQFKVQIVADDVQPIQTQSSGTSAKVFSNPPQPQAIPDDEIPF